MNTENQKLFTIMTGIVLFSILSLSTVYAQTPPTGGMGGMSMPGSGYSGQYGNSTFHGSHSGSFSHSGNFTRNETAYNMNSFNHTKSAYPGGNNTISSTNMPTGTNASSTIPSNTPVAPMTSTPTTTLQNILSPLQQFRSGTPANKISCEEGFQLIIKSEDGSPACVDSGTYTLLVERGWGH
jgi:hypothetical protein